jgi:hypothetical protein
MGNCYVFLCICDGKLATAYVYVMMHENKYGVMNAHHLSRSIAGN